TLAWDVQNSDGSKNTLGWRPTPEDPTRLEAFIERRTIMGARISETVFKPNGWRFASAWDVSPDGKGETWISYVQTFDPQARFIRQQWENDDLTRRIYEEDPDNAYEQNWSARDT